MDVRVLKQIGLISACLSLGHMTKLPKVCSHHISLPKISITIVRANARALLLGPLLTLFDIVF